MYLRVLDSLGMCLLTGVRFFREGCLLTDVQLFRDGSCLLMGVQFLMDGCAPTGVPFRRDGCVLMGVSFRSDGCVRTGVRFFMEGVYLRVFVSLGMRVCYGCFILWIYDSFTQCGWECTYRCSIPGQGGVGVLTCICPFWRGLYLRVFRYCVMVVYVLTGVPLLCDGRVYTYGCSTTGGWVGIIIRSRVFHCCVLGVCILTAIPLLRDECVLTGVPLPRNWCVDTHGCSTAM